MFSFSSLISQLLLFKALLYGRKLSFICYDGRLVSYNLKLTNKWTSIFKFVSSGYIQNAPS